MARSPGGRWPRKREVAALWLLHERGPTLNLGEALGVLREELCVTKRTASNLLKRLRRLGAVKLETRGGGVVVEAVDPAEFIGRLASSYIAFRKGRCRGGG
ncbi:hypothetical protein [Stetteria hydrogenophila]